MPSCYNGNSLELVAPCDRVTYRPFWDRRVGGKAAIWGFSSPNKPVDADLVMPECLKVMLNLREIVLFPLRV